MQRENNGFGPFLEKRGHRASYVAIVLLVAFAAATIVVERQHGENIWSFYLFAFGFSILACMVGEMIRRCCLFAEELRHCGSRYEGNWKKAFFAAFDYRNAQLLALVVAVTLCLAVYSLLEDVWSPYKYHFTRLFFLNAIFVPIFVYIFGLRDLSGVEHSQVSEKENKNLADGLAWGYYFGYLKIVLPALDDQINLTEKYRYNLYAKKVFIIVPKDCQVFDNISNKHSDPNNLVKVDGNLEALKKSRGGIQDRVYRHTVHSVKDEATGETYYCIMEYATPLMNLFDMSNDQEAGLSRAERDNQVNLFVAKLRAILDKDHECRDKYQLVTFRGGEQDIGEVMIRALKDCSLEIDAQ